jgi:hypothetical protein
MPKNNETNRYFLESKYISISLRLGYAYDLITFGNVAAGYAYCLNPPFIHSTTFIVSDDWKIGCGTPFRIAKKHGIVFTPQYPGV